MKPSVQRFAVLAGGLALAALVAGKGLAQSDDLPEGPGKADVASTCSMCHGTSVISAQHRSPEEWADVVARMKGMGAVMDADKEKSIVTYLNTSLGTGAPAAATPATTDPAAPPAPAAPATPPASPAPQK